MPEEQLQSREGEAGEGSEDGGQMSGRAETGGGGGGFKWDHIRKGLRAEQGPRRSSSCLPHENGSPGQVGPISKLGSGRCETLQ